MARFIVEGSCNKLSGKLTVQGSKNGALPLLSASVLVAGESVFTGCPKLTDIRAAENILTYLGCRVNENASAICVDSTDAYRYAIPDGLMREMRSSIVFLGALLGRFGRAELTAPGGCEIGLRPIDLHLEAMRALGAVIDETGGRLVCSCPNGLKGARISLSFPSVGATENILLAACTANGDTLVINAAREPEVAELAEYLNSCGAKIFGAGESVIRIEGVKRLNASCHTVWQDRIAAVTYMSAAAVTGGDLWLDMKRTELLLPVVEPFEKMGCTVDLRPDAVRFKGADRLDKFGMVRTLPFPGFPTDSQADFAVMASVARGTSTIVENIFENRFKYVCELRRMGAQIRTENRIAIIEGVSRLSGAEVTSPDLRGGSALVVAALCSDSVTVVDDIYHIDRGYENFEKQLENLGVKIKREE
ncbi:MAG: UDP-N-acetylglucosamine 1-carboxyvinyltransferase [Clostridia bacterium]|nr:UDP-N-acetylglucosamine 1-carboxyvinyltransferase [Clostridia bacterium]